MTIDQLERALLELPVHERARLAERLISSLEQESEVEQAWYDEAERRLEQLQAGSVREVPADQVYGTLRPSKER